MSFRKGCHRNGDLKINRSQQRLFSHSHGNGHCWNHSPHRDRSRGSKNVCRVTSFPIPLCWCHRYWLKFSRAVNTASSNTGEHHANEPYILSLPSRWLSPRVPSEPVLTLGNVHPNQQRHALGCPHGHTNRNTNASACLLILAPTYTGKYLQKAR